MHGRSRVLAAAKAAKMYAIDGVYSNINDLEGLKSETEMVKRMGYEGKLLIHPKHVPIVQDVFKPNPEEVAYYQKVISEFEAALAKGLASISVDGKMIDYAMAERARRFLKANKIL